MTQDFPCFVYGTLLSVEVQRSLIGRIPQSHSAVLTGYSVVCVIGESFPSLKLTDDADQVFGLLLYDLSIDDYRIFDMYESDEFALITVSVFDSVLSKDVSAWCYVLRKELTSMLSANLWDISEWASSEFFQKTLLECEAIRREYGLVKDLDIIQ